MSQQSDPMFVVEVLGTKGWEEISTHNDLPDALHRFTDELGKTPIAAVRLTSPTDLSIYDTAPPLTEEQVEAEHLHSVRAELHPTSEEMERYLWDTI